MRALADLSEHPRPCSNAIRRGHDGCDVVNLPEASADTSRWSGFMLGVRLGLPVAPGIMAFGLVVGAAAARQGLSFVQSLAMNFLVCSGIAQLVVLEIWPPVLTWGVIVTITLLTAVIGARLFLMSVAMRPWFGQLPGWQA